MSKVLIINAHHHYPFAEGRLNASLVHADEVASGFSQSVELPSYTLLNLGAIYEFGNWAVSGTINNVTDEEYFRSNFPNLFGTQIVLPELPINWSAKVQYRF